MIEKTNKKIVLGSKEYEINLGTIKVGENTFVEMNEAINEQIKLGLRLLDELTFTFKNMLFYTLQ